MRTRLFSITLCCLFFWQGVAPAQEAGMVIDKIVAKVDDYIVLNSDVETTYLSYRASGKELPANPRCEILRQLLIEKVMLAQAEIDSVIADPIRVEGELERRMTFFYEQYGGRDKMEEVLGKSVEDLKDELRDKVSEQLTVQQMRQQITSEVTVTPARVRRFYKQIPKDSLPFFPATYKVAQIVRYPDVSADEKTRIKQKLIGIRDKILSGEASFAEMAEKHSEDVGSAANGGCYDFVQRGEFVPAYEATVFNLEPGQLSLPVESAFGFHIIKLVERRGNRYKSCHILIKPEATESGFQKTEHFLDSLRTLVAEEKADFSKLAQEFSEDRETRSNGGYITTPKTGSAQITADDLDYATFMTIDSMKIGQVSKPVRFRTADEKDAVRIVLYKQKIPPHTASYQNDYERLHKIALQKEEERALATWFDKTVRELYIYLDDEYKSCGLLDGL